MDALLAEAHRQALDVAKRAYAPYSHYHVGAALVLKNGTIVVGCNVENASYGGTICAERTAFCAAVATYGEIAPQALVLVTEPAAVPCGLCLQVMAEFCRPDFAVYLGTPKELGKKVLLKELLPKPFGPESLK